MTLPKALLRRWLGDDEAVVYECRHCGTTLQDADSACPHCGSTDSVEYQLE